MILFILIQLTWFFESSLRLDLLILDDFILNNKALLLKKKGKMQRELNHGYHSYDWLSADHVTVVT